MRSIYSVVDQNGSLVQGVKSLTDGEAAIAHDFGISAGELRQLQTKRRNSKSFIAFASADGKFREIIAARTADWT